MFPEGFLIKLLDAIKVGFIYVDEFDQVAYSNNEAMRLLQIDKEKYVGRNVLTCHPTRVHKQMRVKLKELKNSPVGEWHRVGKGTDKYVESYYSSVYIEDQYKGVLIALKDVTDRETLAQDLLKAFDEMAVLYQAAQLVSSTLNVKQVLDNIVGLAQKVVGFDAGGILIYDRVSKEMIYRATYNYSYEQIEGLRECRPFDELLKSLDKRPSVGPVEGHFTCSALSKIEIAVPMLINNNIYGVWFVENHQDVQFKPDRKHLMAAFAGLTSPAISNAWLFERTRFEATVDKLTGLFNRQYFDRVLDLEKDKARLMSTPLSMIMIDINRLKYINDTFGHEVGDYIIKESAELLKKSVRKGELIFRFGGDEMAILLPNSGQREASKVVKRIRFNIEEWNCRNLGNDYFLHMSIGCYTATDADSLKILVSTADSEMYKDKEEYYRSHGLLRVITGPR